MVFLAFAEGSFVQLVPDGTIFIHIALILLMIWVLNRTLFRPINKILAQRANSTGGRSTEADELRRQAIAKQMKYDETLREARSEGYQHVETERNQALAMSKEQIEGVKTETSVTIASEKVALETAVETARQKLAADATAIAEKITSNILKS